MPVALTKVFGAGTNSLSWISDSEGEGEVWELPSKRSCTGGMTPPSDDSEKSRGRRKCSSHSMKPFPCSYPRSFNVSGIFLAEIAV